MWITVPGFSRSFGMSQSSLRPIANCAGSRGVAELQVAIELLGQVAAHAVGEDRDLGVDVGAGLERALRLAVLADAAVAGAHADHALVPSNSTRLAGKPQNRSMPSASTCAASHFVNWLSEMM